MNTRESLLRLKPAMVAMMHEFMESQGYVLDITDKRLHHEIYLSDARKVAPEKLKPALPRNYTKVLRELPVESSTKQNPG